MSCRYQVGRHAGHANRPGDDHVSVCGSVSFLPKIHAVLPVLDGAGYSQPLVSSTQVSTELVYITLTCLCNTQLFLQLHSIS